MLVFECEINFFNIIRGIKVIIMFLARFFDVMLTIKEERVIRAFSTKILSLEIKFIILNKFAIIL